MFLVSGENITLTEEQIQAAVAQGQIIDAANSEELIMEVSGDEVPVKLGHMGDVCLSDEEEENEEEEETEDDIHALERNMHGIVSEMSDWHVSKYVMDKKWMSSWKYWTEHVNRWISDTQCWI